MAFRNKVTYSQRPNHAARAAHAKGDAMFRTYDTSQIRPKKSKGPVIFVIILLAMVAVVAFFGVSAVLRGCSGSTDLLPEGQQVTIEVADGSGAQAIAASLQQAKLISKPSEFTSRVSSRGVETQLKPGTYFFTGGMTVDKMIDILVEGPTFYGTPLVIPEGYRLSEVAKRVEEVTKARIAAAEFLDAASDASRYAADYPFLKDVGTNSLEGFLFPKTYQLSDTDTADTIIRMLLTQFGTETAGLNMDYPKSKGLNTYDVVKLASIVEKESTENTRKQVASVFYNRLEIGMALQSDATTAYEVGHDPTWEETHADTPYSTYTNNGLPPTPICSPGLDALEAVCNPDQTDYLYFYFKQNANGDLEYFFSKTNDEHNEAVFNG